MVHRRRGRVASASVSKEDITEMSQQMPEVKKRWSRNL